MENDSQLTSVHKAIRVLRLFSQDEPELGISEISRKLGIAKSTISRLVQILCEEDILERNGETRKYRLSLAAFEIGSVVYHEMEVAQIALPLLKSMVDKVNGVIQLSTYDNGGIVYLLKIPEQKDSKIINTMGRRVPSHCTASGKLLLAHQDEEEIARYITQPLKAYTNKTICSSEELWNELILIRKRGYSISHGEYREMISSVAMPIFNDDDDVIASLSVTKPTHLMQSLQIKQIVEQMRVFSRLISEQMGSMI
jgi:IclR family KDG regulon transcriptional repressor